MTMHGDMSFWAFLKWDRNQKSHAFKRDLYAHPGFRHFMGAVGPGPDQQFALYNRPFDPSDVYMWQDAERVMDKLAYVMTFELIDTDEDDDGVLRCLNRSIPSGYTYLLQIAAHDLVHSSLSVSRSKANSPDSLISGILLCGSKRSTAMGRRNVPTRTKPMRVDFATVFDLEEFARTISRLTVAATASTLRGHAQRKRLMTVGVPILRL